MAEILQEGHVFYNPVQEFNRDMSICVLATFIERYKKELAEKLSTKINNKNKRKEQEAVSAFISFKSFVYIYLFDYSNQPEEFEYLKHSPQLV